MTDTIRRVDLRSDTVTQPTQTMRQAMFEAPVGDDFLGEDPTVNRLQALAAERLGFEAALWVASGVMGNEIAIRVSTQPGDEVLVERRSHIVEHELAGMAQISGVSACTVEGLAGRIRPEDVEAHARPRAYYRSDLTLAVLENTHNLAGGTVYTPEQHRAVVAACRHAGLKVHVDGARIWHASVALGVSPRELLAGVDTASVALSKGLCAPAGSLLLGRAATIDAARRVRKMLGGGMRQVGILAAAGIVALDEMIPRLAEDHAKAQRIGECLRSLPGVDPSPVRTNIVVARLHAATAPAIVTRLSERGVLASAMDHETLRFVTHRDVSASDCAHAANVIEETLSD
jgi:threonine aldolase